MKCGGKPKMQLAGEVQCPPGFKSDGFGNCIPDEAQKINFTDYTKLPSEKINIPLQPLIKEEDVVGPPPINEPVNQPVYKDRIDEGIAKGIISGKKDEDGNEGNARDQYNAIHEEKDKEPQPKLDPYWLFRGFRNGMSWLSGMVERGRQNRYDWMQQTALGQVNPMPTDDYQPNPYSLYAKYGGKLKDYLKYGGFLKKYQNGGKNTSKEEKDYFNAILKNPNLVVAFPDRNSSFPSDSIRMFPAHKSNLGIPYIRDLGMAAGISPIKKDTYNNLFNMYLNPDKARFYTDSLPRLANPTLLPKQKYGGLQNVNYFGPAFSNKAEMDFGKSELKKGGLTPNKAREILHDGTAQGKPLTDKQRRYFGTMSKGHTNFRGK